jgi:hypothetical protein
MQDENQDPLDEFKNILDEGEEICEDITEQGRKRTEFAQELSDMARTTRQVLDEIPDGNSGTGIEDAIEDWRTHVSVIRQERDNYNPYYVPISSSTGSTGTISTNGFFDDVSKNLPHEYKQRFDSALDIYHKQLGKSANKNMALSLIDQFGLDKSFQNRVSVRDQFETSYDAINRPVTGKFDPANTSLIPMREAIGTMIDHLLYLRPDRSNIKESKGLNKDWRKVIAIADQLKRDDLPEYQPQSWAEEWSNLKNKKLSPGKTERIDRDEWFTRIHLATIFIIGFLSGLDSKKIRS